ncbi:sigma-70 family RNA polymerase sigma factor [Dokdonella sp.]|uniref:RNA polymerase sigma factor n=1 Tax=Dokdonella sp. TaxID=2291710 RepID=UPI002C82E07F|nr:sigma-70 family RNA polymerase sigma factor [Dokdonella sp.]HOX72267.1 sigma-70 family RNA polymerase sigma factor [Dokdonella sp.]HPN79172.1 sigma-70 family RNA polymerase sigma factor [Dokdonella sp.]
MTQTPPTREDDQALVDAVLGGVAGAFEQLVRQYQKLCWHVIHRMVRHTEDTQDLCQETFLRVHQYLHQYRNESALKSWVAQVAYSVAKRHLERKRIPIAESSAEGDGLSLLDRITDDFDIEAASIEGQSAGHLHEAIDCLPPLQRTILTLYHLDELPIADIAVITGLAEGTIKSHLFRARKQLRDTLTESIGVAA